MMLNRGYKVMQRIYRAKNGVEEQVRFCVPKQARPRADRTRRTTPRKQEANRNSAAHRLGRILNNNFEQGDLFITLTYSDAAYRKLEQAVKAELPKRCTKQKRLDAIFDAAVKEGKRFMRRLRDAGFRGGKSVLATADMDGKTGEVVRVHHHIILTGDAFSVVGKKPTLGGRLLPEIWKHGIVEWEFLRGGSYNKLAAYLIRQVRHRENRKKYTCTRNMEPVDVEEFEIFAGTTQELSAPKDAIVEERQANAEYPTMQYLRYLCPPKPDAEKGKRRR